MKKEVSPALAAVVVAIVAIVVGGFFYVRSSGMLRAKEQNKQAEANGQRMMQYMNGSPATGGSSPGAAESNGQRMMQYMQQRNGGSQ